MSRKVVSLTAGNWGRGRGRTLTPRWFNSPGKSTAEKDGGNAAGP